MREVSCIVVTYNSVDVVDVALESLAADPLLRLIVVDNASVDGTSAYVRKTYPNVELVQSDRNLGFAGGVNLGLRHRSSGDVLLLNPDARINAEQLGSLLSVLDHRPDVGIVAPLITHPGGRLETWQAGRRMSLWTLFTHYSGLSRFSARIRWFEGTYRRANVTAADIEAVDWVSGGCMLIRGDVIDNVGGLSDRWFMYGEDREYCDRVRAAGLAVVVATHVPATHLVGQSSDGTPPSRSRSLWIDNSFDYFVTSRKRSALSRSLWRGIVGLGLSSRAIGYSIRARKATTAASRSMWRAEASKFWTFARTGFTARDLEHRQRGREAR